MYHHVVTLKNIHLYLVSSGLSPDVVKNYGDYLRKFFEWFRMKYPNKDAAEVDAAVITEWLDNYKHWANSTKYKAVASLRGFYKFTYSPDHPVTRMKIHRIDAGPQRTLEEDELTALMTAIPTNTPRGIRNLAIITLMADTGMRSGEISGLELNNVNLRKGTLNVLVKGGVWNEKVFAEYTASCLESWLNIRSNYAEKGIKNVFVSLGGKTPGRPLTKSGMLSLFDELSKAADLGHVTPHAMRRTFATLATQHGAPTRLVQLAGGWKSIRMVEHYTRKLNSSHIRRYSPVNSLMGIKNGEDE